MVKSRDAFRTISEVADWLDTPAHVLRFWESKFTQIKPVKRAGGRRYYRPEDMALLGGIKTLLHDQGMTIKGAQKLLRDMGIKHVSGLGPQPLDLDGDGADTIELGAGPEGHMPRDSGDNRPTLMPPLLVVPEPEPAIDDNWPFSTERDTAPQNDVWPADPVSRPVARTGPVAARDTAPQPTEPVMTGGTLSQLLRANRRHLAARAARIAPLARRLSALRDQMARSQG